MKPVWIVLAGLLLLIVGLGAAQLTRATDFARVIGGLNAGVAAGDAVGAVDVATLPPLVRAFAERNGGRVGAARVVVATQIAEMRLTPEQDFFPLTATQMFGTHTPDFVWHARATMMGAVPVEVVDAYVGGHGLLEARIASSITVARQDGELADRGEAVRYLAELPFNPDAILNAAMLEWTAIDATQLRVSMKVGSGVVAALLRFDAAGDIVEVEAQRPRLVDGTVVESRWVGRLSGYAAVGAYRLPMQGEVLWDLPEGEFVYWRGGMTGLVPVAD